MNRSLPFLIGLALTGSCSHDESPPPNVLFIAVDDLRPELNCYGATQIKSPNIDRLASRGITFTNAYCNIPVCGASRASILTGLRPTRARFLTYYTRADEDAPGITTLPGYFRENGYYTVSLSKVFHHENDAVEAWDEIWSPKIRGSWRNYILEENLLIDSLDYKQGPPFERADVPDNAYKDGQTADKAISDLKRLKESGKAFFLATGFLKPHLPFNAPEKYWQLYDSADIKMPVFTGQPKNAPDAAMHNSGELRDYGGIPPEGLLDDDLTRKLIHGYYACVSYTDKQVGRLLDALDDLELTENTIVILWGDHGWNLGEHGMWCKHCNFETSLHAPLIISAPGIQGGKMNLSVSEFIDIYPTLCDLAGLEAPPHLEGESLKDRMLNPGTTENDYAVCKWTNGATLVDGNYFFTEWSNPEEPYFARMLYDHLVDPDETLNISESEDNHKLAEELAAKLRNRWGKDYDKPISEYQAVK